jgi:gag-polypeptide of LTR copia-type
MVEETEKEKVDTSASVEEKENRKNDVKILYLIQQVISDKIFLRIIEARSSKEAWEILQKEFQGTDKVKTVKILTFKRNF